MENAHPRAIRGRPTQLQKEMVVELMEANPTFARGRLEGPDAGRRAADLWRAAAQRLNASGGCMKTWKEWRKYWNDKKAHLKGRAARRLQHAVGTGGGPPANIPPLGQLEERLLAVLGDGFGQPTPDAAAPLMLERPNVDGSSPIQEAGRQEIVVADVHEIPDQMELDYYVIEPAPEVDEEVLQAPPVPPAAEGAGTPDRPATPIEPPLSPRPINRGRRGRHAANRGPSPPRQAPNQAGYGGLRELIVEQERVRRQDEQQRHEDMRLWRQRDWEFIQRGQEDARQWRERAWQTQLQIMELIRQLVVQAQGLEDFLRGSRD